MSEDELREQILAILNTGIAEKEMMHTEDMPETTSKIIALTQRIALEARIDENEILKKSDNFNNTLSRFGRVELEERLDELKSQLQELEK